MEMPRKIVPSSRARMAGCSKDTSSLRALREGPPAPPPDSHGQSAGSSQTKGILTEDAGARPCPSVSLHMHAEHISHAVQAGLLADNPASRGQCTTGKCRATLGAVRQFQGLGPI